MLHYNNSIVYEWMNGMGGNIELGDPVLSDYELFVIQFK